MGWILAGAFVVVLVMIDVVWTTLTAMGSGPLTTYLTEGVKWASGGAHRLLRRRAVILPSGSLAIVMLGGLWLMALWLGWFLLFSAFPKELVSAQTGQAADSIERIYYVGFTLSTLGMGDFKPTSDRTQLFTVMASFNGLVIVTLVITYALPLVQGAVQRRKLAFNISLLGKTPQEIVLRASHPNNVEMFESSLQALTNDLVHCSEQRLAYPILDLFYCRQRRYSLGLQIAKLDEALSILTFGLSSGVDCHAYPVSSLRSAIEQYLSRVACKGEPEPPPAPSVGALDDHQLSLSRARGMQESYKYLRHRRCQLLKLVLDEGWPWSEVERAHREGASS